MSQSFHHSDRLGCSAADFAANPGNPARTQFERRQLRRSSRPDYEIVGLADDIRRSFDAAQRQISEERARVFNIDAFCRSNNYSVVISGYFQKGDALGSDVNLVLDHTTAYIVLPTQVRVSLWTLSIAQSIGHLNLHLPDHVRSAYFTRGDVSASLKEQADLFARHLLLSPKDLRAYATLSPEGTEAEKFAKERGLTRAYLNTSLTSNMIPA